MACNCTFCQRERRIDELRGGMPPLIRALIEDLHNELVHAELDRDVHKAVIDGTWPSADSIIKHARSGATKRRSVK